MSEAIRGILEAKASPSAPAPSASGSRLDAAGVVVSASSCADGPPEVVGSARAARRRAGARTPTTSALDRAGVATDARGYIQVDDSLATNVPGIWALGDCNGRGAFTHTAYNDFEIVAANLLDGERRKVSDRIAGLRALHRSAAGPRRPDRAPRRAPAAGPC